MTNINKIKQTYLDMYYLKLFVREQVNSLENQLDAQIAQMEKEVDELERQEFDGLTRIECLQTLGADPLTGFTKQEIDNLVNPTPSLVSSLN
jgi:predicted ribosome quality control (RQC) complex YloA/Tae2 family protein